MIREATKTDYKALAALVFEVYILHVDARPDVYNSDINPLTELDFEELRNNESKKVFVMEIDSELVAYSIIRTEERKDIRVIRDTKFIFIDDFSVKASCRKKGYGRRLFDFINTYGKELKVDSIQLKVWEFNEDVIAFYESIGMKTRNRLMEIDLL